MQSLWQKFLALLLVALNPLCVWLFDWPAMPKGQQLDLSRFELTWSDEFEGDTLDAAKWKDHHNAQSGVSIRRGGYWSLDMAEVADGQLNIKTEYLEDGLRGYPAGYYTAGLDTRGLFEQKYGYFEVRCRLPKGEGTWAAFWMLNDGMSQVTGNGRSGAEIDVFESAYYAEDWPKNQAISSAVHIDGYGEAHKGFFVGKFLVNDPYDTFNTYGVEWNENEYIFYINGVETKRGTYGEPSQAAQYLLLSVEFGGENGVPDNGWAGDIRNNDLLPTVFEVDYVRAYQYKDLP